MLNQKFTKLNKLSRKAIIFLLIASLVLPGFFVYAGSEDSEITLQANPQTIAPGQESVLSGELSPSHPNVSVYLHYWNGSKWVQNVDKKTNNNSKFSFKVKPQTDTFYTVLWTGDSDHSWSYSEYIQVKVQEQTTESNLTLSASPEVVAPGEYTMLSGTLSPSHTNTSIYLYYWDDTDWVYILQNKTNLNSKFTLTVKPEKDTYYCVLWTGDSDHNWSYSEYIQVKVQQETTESQITIKADPETVQPGQQSTLSGTLTPSHSNVNVYLYYWNGEDWVNSAQTKTDSNSNFSFQVNPESNTYYCVLWTGDSDHNWSYSEFVQVTVEEEGSGASNTPWSGWWWPYLDTINPNIYDENGPLDKYDRYVQNNHGYNPGTRSWEYGNHYTLNPSATWWGHCHALAAVSILEPEPRTNKNRGGMTFTVGDQKGMLTELYYSPQSLMWGDRYGDGIGSEDYSDIAPSAFQSLLQNYIKNERKSLVFDTNAGYQVWNFPAYKYSMTSTEEGSRTNYTTTVWFANYTSADSVGTSSFTKTYTYWISGDQSEWTGNSVNDHPDFVWLPTGRYQQGNPINYNIVKEITN